MKMHKLALYTREFSNIFAMPLSFYIGYPLLRPTVFAFYLTRRCNSRCRMCDFWRSQTKDDLSFDQVTAILDDLKAFGVKTISFSAEGEMFTREDAIDILQYAKKLGFVFGINSNGLAIDRQLAERIAGVAPNSIVFSIDSTNPTQYAYIRGVKDGLQRVMSAVSNLQEAGYNKVSGGAVIRDDNLDEVPKLLAFARRLGLHGFRFTAMQRHGFSKVWTDEQWGKLAEPGFQQELQQVLGELRASVKSDDLLANSEPYLSMIPPYFKADHFYPIPCIEGYYKGKIMPNGDLSLCPIMGKTAVIGNLSDEPLSVLWYGKKAQEVRKIIRRGKCPGCWLSCYGEDNLRFAPRYALAANFNALRRALKLV
ncbi:MAG: radical SAM protein, partial [Desulfobulbaceae bacterium]|nr:radical SAM protein [Desulfobulbaceae bacterium]